MFDEYVIFEFGIYKDSKELDFIKKIFELPSGIGDSVIKIIGKGLIDMNSFVIEHSYVDEEGLYINLRTSHRLSDKFGYVKSRDGGFGPGGASHLGEDSKTILEFLQFHGMNLNLNGKRRLSMI
jgi:hypothetical protein